MEPLTKVSGVVAPLDRVNVDTDQIIPAQFMKRIERTGYGEFAFFAWRFLPSGEPNPDFELNNPAYQGAQILVAGRNFGCGSSREHAPWALQEYGFRVVIAPTIADIFFNNCLQNGMLPLVLPEETVSQLMRKAQEQPGYRLTVDLEEQAIYDEAGFRQKFEIDPFIRHRLLNGLDDIGLTMQQEDKIRAFEAKRPRWLEPAERV
ncbi:MAG TPA: 3-isopropylmalate dehydratase small subunit [Dehalococcoidia bacterium]|nr:3-isopropylmalate dehydratase small subunit [Dehalococcoidia bacterium]